ncbi:MAG: hypothetical protein SFU83_14485 [Meiothermus sp.]|nr:hypothetical protein [Meiothermus sp.]
MNERSAMAWDLVGKLAMVAMPIVLGWFLNVGSQRIADSIESRNFIEGLIDELSDTRSQSRQDIALILLKEYIGQEQPQMVAKIAEVVFAENMERLVRSNRPDSITELQGSTAFEVLAELNPERAREIRESTQQRVLAALLDEVNVQATR